MEHDPSVSDSIAADAGNSIRLARRAAGLTQAELAEGLVAASYISLIESGRRSPSPELLHKFSARLSVPVSALGLEQDEVKANFCLNAAMVALTSGNANESRAFAQDALRLAAQESHTRFGATAILCELDLRDQSRTDSVASAIRVLDESPRAAQQQRSRLLLAVLRTLQVQGDVSYAVDIGTRWLRRADDEAWPEDNVVELLCMTATCHAERGDLAIARELAQRALQLAVTLSSPKALVQAHWETAWIQYERGELSQAQENIQTALKLSELAEMTETLPRIQLAAASLMAALPNPDLVAAKELAETAWMHSIAQRDSISTAYALVARARCALLEEDLIRAMQLAEEGLLVAEAPPALRIELHLCRLRAALKRTGRIEWPNPSLAAEVAALTIRNNSRAVSRFWAQLATLLEEAGLAAPALEAYRQAVCAAHLLPPDETRDATAVETASKGE